ncbi:type IV pilus modification PilV family protein [Thermodesulfovibrio aggregans]|uniref:type IV pilus modification PilV family protein n=1 Tax=Thermodesulfovibrio aggregans TaxID=86166 RepID=UPI000743AD75|nr:prepilin-type N-terminal cleavage/methylation domain-containing protein [Thermodesulfovibrio aggregans]
MNKKLSNKGFTLIELLIAMIITLIVMLGLLKGILEYNKFSIRAKMKDRATEIARQFTAYIESLPSQDESILYANNSSWNSVECSATSCNFFETETEFYNIGSPTPSNPIGNLSSNLRLYPSADNPDAQCNCRGSNCPNTLPVCTYEGFSGKRIYVGLNVVKFSQTGKAASVMVWYFEPFTNEFKIITNLVIKG